MPTPTLSVIVDTSAQHNVGVIWANPGAPFVVDSTAGPTQVFALDSTAMPGGTSLPSAWITKYRLTNVTASTDKNYDAVRENDNHLMDLMLQTSDNNADWTNQQGRSFNAYEGGTGRLRWSLSHTPQFARVTARLYPTRDGTHTQATVLMGIENMLLTY